MWKFIKQNWLLILSLLYVLSPIDFIPELFVGPLGIIDDSFVLFMLLVKALSAHFQASKDKSKIS